MGRAACIYLHKDVYLLGKKMVYDGLPFPGTGFRVPDVVNIYLI